jgi:hypothetical protein
MPMLRKTALALVLVVVAVLFAAAVAMLRPAPSAEASPSAASESREAKAPRSTIDEGTLRISRARWEQRREQIRAAHAPRAHADAPPVRARSAPGCVDGACGPDEGGSGTDGGGKAHDEAPGDVMFSRFIDETTKLTQGCEELLEGEPRPVRIAARLIGAPEVGTLLDSVQATGPEGIDDALTECLTQGMYTLDFGDAGTNFERNTELIHGLLDDVANQNWLTPEQIAKIRQQMLDAGLDPDRDPMVMVGTDEERVEPP